MKGLRVLTPSALFLNNFWFVIDRRGEAGSNE